MNHWFYPTRVEFEGGRPIYLTNDVECVTWRAREIHGAQHHGMFGYVNAPEDRVCYQEQLREAIAATQATKADILNESWEDGEELSDFLQVAKVRWFLVGKGFTAYRGWRGFLNRSIEELVVLDPQFMLS